MAAQLYNDLPQPLPQPTPTATATPFPARTRQAARMLDGLRTDISVTKFSDKIMVTIAQEGYGLGHFVHVPLESIDPTLTDRRSQLHSDDLEGADLLPLPHLTATTILGGGDPELNTLGQLLATQIASTIAASTPEEKRLLVVGLGLQRREIKSEDFLTVLEMTMACLS